MLPSDIEKKITKKTKAIIPVHLYGQSADMDTIMAVADKHNLKVIEDGAQAISSQYKDGRCAGTIGDIGCYSFFPSKNLGCFGDGGVVTTNSEEMFEKLIMLRMHGSKIKYYHEIIGGNFRLDALQAAVIRIKLPHLNKWSQGRRDNASLYTKYFIQHGLASETGRIEFDNNNKVLIPKAVYEHNGHENFHIYNQFIIRVEKRNELRKFLTENEIASEIYYPVPFHLQECYAELGYRKGDFPNSEFAADHSIALPIYPELSEEQIKYVVGKIAEFLK